MEEKNQIVLAVIDFLRLRSEVKNYLLLKVEGARTPFPPSWRRQCWKLVELHKRYSLSQSFFFGVV